MDKYIDASKLSESDINYILSVKNKKSKKMSLREKIDEAQKILDSGNWPVIKNSEISGEAKNIKSSLMKLESSVAAFSGIRSHSMYKVLLNRLIFVSKRINNFTVPNKPKKLKLKFAGIKDEYILKYYNLKNQLNKKIRPVTSDNNNNDGVSLPSENPNGEFTSRFVNDFEAIQVLGEGGFGCVFEAKHKLDRYHYAVKRVILLRNHKSNPDKVMREVEALSKLEHKNIVRYHTCWIEHPCSGWIEEHDKKFKTFSDSSATTSSGKSSTKSDSKSVDVPLQEPIEPCFDINRDYTDKKKSSDDSWILFEEEQSLNQENGIAACQDSADIEKDVPDEKENLKNADNKALNVNKSQIVDYPAKRNHSGKKVENIATVCSDSPSYLYIQMELCDKQNLKDWLSVNKDRDNKTIMGKFSQILNAVAHVHSENLIHRDLKPTNILVSKNGTIKLGDFGSILDLGSRSLSKEDSAVSRRGHTKGVGTMLYMSPELLTSEDYDYKVDIYSLGIILFELLHYFPTEMERRTILNNLRTQSYPKGFAEKYPFEFGLIQNMLDEDPDVRMSTKEIQEIISCKNDQLLEVSSSDESGENNIVSEILGDNVFEASQKWQ